MSCASTIIVHLSENGDSTGEGTLWMWNGSLKQNQQYRCKETSGKCMVDEMRLQDVKQWYDRFIETGSVLKASRLGRPRIQSPS
jgi:hypothetical protein